MSAAISGNYGDTAFNSLLGTMRLSGVECTVAVIQEFKEFMNRRGFDMIYLDSAKFAEFMKADNEDNGKALKSLGMAK
jgi:hypothetical protein